MKQAYMCKAREEIVARPHYAGILALETAYHKARWFDENGVPRFCEFAPSRLANTDIYLTECALLLITCQGCQHPFKVAISGTKWRAIFDAILNLEVEYGAPPNIQCCPAGPTMNSVPRRVLEYWSLIGPGPAYTDPIRDSQVELDIVPRWWDAAAYGVEASA